MDIDNIDDMEREAVKGESMLHQMLSRAVSKIRSLQHELTDPNYLYVGRIHRQAILSRNAEIDALREELTKLKQRK